MKIIEIFKSIQGEGSLIGIPCTFIRTAGCDFKCPDCDSRYSWSNGTEMSIDDIIIEVQKYNTKNIIITGGEPIEQFDLEDLCLELKDSGCIVSIQTNGSRWHSAFDFIDHVFMDMKPIFRGVDGNMHASSTSLIKKLYSADEIKVLVGDESDLPYAYHVNKIAAKYGITTIVQVRNDYPNDNLEDLIQKYKWLVEQKFEYPYKILPQLHTWVWGNQRGV